ncbi:hypothetical protein YC2023_064738 [Brassica napus]
MTNTVSTAGATVKLACNNTKTGITMETKAVKSGYFFMLAPNKLTTYAFHTCRAWPTNPGPAAGTVTSTVPSKSINIAEPTTFYTLLVPSRLNGHVLVEVSTFFFIRHFEMVSVFDFVSSVAEFLDERRDNIMNVEPAALLMAGLTVDTIDIPHDLFLEMMVNVCTIAHS